MTGSPGHSSLPAHLIVRGDCWVTCHTYDDHGPILSIGTAPTNLMITVADSNTSAEGLTFAHALLGAAKTFLAECERLAEPGESAA